MLMSEPAEIRPVIREIEVRVHRGIWPARATGPARPPDPIRRCDRCGRPSAKLYFATRTGELLCRHCDRLAAAVLDLETKGQSSGGLSRQPDAAPAGGAAARTSRGPLPG